MMHHLNLNLSSWSQHVFWVHVNCLKFMATARILGSVWFAWSGWSSWWRFRSVWPPSPPWSPTSYPSSSRNTVHHLYLSMPPCHRLRHIDTHLAYFVRCRKLIQEKIVMMNQFLTKQSKYRKSGINMSPLFE